MEKIVEIDGLKIKFCEKVYPPSEDTFLLLDTLKKFDVKNKDILEIGTGTGVIAIYLAKRGANVWATDIKEQAIKCAEENAKINNVKIVIKKTNLLEGINKKFDMIIFNPPYLPEDNEIDKYLEEEDKIDLIGGAEGVEITIDFLKNLKKCLKSEGKALILQTTLSNLKKLFHEANKLKFNTKIIAKKRYFFEELMVIEISKKQ